MSVTVPAPINQPNEAFFVITVVRVGPQVANLGSLHADVREIESDVSRLVILP